MLYDDRPMMQYFGHCPYQGPYGGIESLKDFGFIAFVGDFQFDREQGGRRRHHVIVVGRGSGGSFGE